MRAKRSSMRAAPPPRIGYRQFSLARNAVQRRLVLAQRHGLAIGHHRRAFDAASRRPRCRPPLRHTPERPAAGSTAIHAASSLKTCCSSL